MSTKKRVVAVGTATVLAGVGGVVWNGTTGAASAADSTTTKVAAGLLTVGDLGTVPVLAYSWGVSNSGSAAVGGGAGAGKANIQDISVTHYVDGITIDLVRATTSGAHFPSATLVICDPAKCAATTQLTYTLTDVLVSSMSTGTSAAEERSTANVTFSFAKFVLARGGKSTSFDATTSTGN